MSGSDGGRPRRVFAALMLGEARGRQVIDATTAALGGAEAARRAFRMPRAEGLHLTLFFLGDVAGHRIEGLEEELRLVARGCPAPILTLAGVGSFPRRGRERVLWVGVREEGEPRLGLLREGVLDAFAAAGFDPAEERARPFRPHLTVARPRNPRRPRVPASFYEGELEIPWPIETLALVESLRTDGPNRYSAIATFPLPSR